MRNREIITRDLTAMESKITSLKNHVQRQHPVEDFIRLLDDLERLRAEIENEIDNTPIAGYEMNTQARR